MMIRDPPSRIAFLKRSQGWVARKLREMSPKVRDDEMHADFRAMLKSHAENIAPATMLSRPGIHAFEFVNDDT